MTTTPPNKVQHFREAKGISRERLAADVESSYEYIRKLEAQHIPNPSLTMSRRIAKALGVPLDKVFPQVVERAVPVTSGRAK